MKINQSLLVIIKYKNLAEEGINLARRTVTKYRESLNLFSSSQRKTK